MRETSEGTSFYMVRLVIRHFAADERFTRPYRNEPSPEIPLTLPFSGIFRGFFRVFTLTLLLKPLSRSRSVAGVHVCVRVCGCECVCCAVLCVWKTLKTRGNREKCVWYGVCVLCGVVRWENTQKHEKHWENSQNMVSFFGTIWPSVDPKKVRKRAIFPNALFLHFPWDLPTIFARGPIPNGQKRHFSPEVLNQRS